MKNADDLIIFAHIVEAGSFSAASNHWDIPRATLSRRLARLEKQLGVSLINRNSRQFAVTEFGLRVYQHCRTLMTEVDRVYTEASDLQSEPSGQLRISCPIALSQIAVSQMAANFAKQFSRVRLALEVTNRIVDPVSERFDLVIRPTPSRLDDAELIVRKIASGDFLLVAAPESAALIRPTHSPAELHRLPVIGYGTSFEQQHWVLRNTEGAQSDFPLTPVYVSDNLFVIRDAALAGLGIAALPERLCRDALASGQLIRVFADWAPPPMEFFALYPSRRGLTAAGRRLIEHLQHDVAAVLSPE